MRPSKQAPLYRITMSAFLLLCLVLPTMLLAAPARSTKQKQLQQKRTSIQRKIREKRHALAIVRIKVKKTRQQLNVVEHRLRVARGQLQATQLRLDRTQHELRLATIALHDAEQQFSDTRQDTGDRLVALYERGNQGYMDMLLSSDDFGTMLQRAQLASFLMEQDREALSDLKDRKDLIADRRQYVQKKTNEVAVLKQQVALIHNRTAIERKQTARSLSRVRSTAEAMEAELAALERDSRAVTAMLQQMQNSTAGRRRYNTVYAGGPVGGLPVRGRITSRYGYRFHPVLRYRRLHTGVDIAAPTGTPITVQGGGEVIFAGRRGGYGNAVIIDHGRGKSTLYGHMSSIAVRVGQVVSRGQLIGHVGSTGISTGPHLHYEVRMNGSPVNPL